MDYLKVWTNFREVITPLVDAEKGRLFEAMLIYAETGEEPSEFKGNERFLWPVAKQDIDRMAQKCEKMQANGAKGGAAKSKNNQSEANVSKDNQTVADYSEQEQTEANATYKDNIKKDKEKINKDNNNEVVRRFTPPTLEEVRAYCHERGNRVSPERFVDFYTSKGWMVGSNKMKDWKSAVRNWEHDCGRTNTSVQQTTSKTVTAQQYSQREYSEQCERPEEMLARLHDAV